MRQSISVLGSEAVIGRLNHGAIVVPEVKVAAKLYREMLGARVSEPEPLPAHGVTTVFVTLPNTKIELLEPLGEKSPVRGFLERNPAGGLHHLCYEVEDILAARDRRDDDKVREAARLAIRRSLRDWHGKKPVTQVHLVRI